MGCWCIDEPDTPAIQLKYEHPQCHLQIILQLVEEELKEKVPDNIFIIQVKKPFLDKRNIKATDWESSASNFYAGYRMPFLPFQDHPLRNVFKVTSSTLGKRKPTPKKTSGPSKKKQKK